ncbi:uncharacterized protein [Coffea arabica]|uniref:RNase H type-1 domain-containing protein n=1 Tax=Coffea arabica TaxID=13443 RepID=A0ABM4VCA2_COFAR
MYFDGAAHRDGAGAGVIFYTPESDILPHSFTLTCRCSNNVVEYQALILGLKTAVDMKQLHLRVYGDSKLVVNQFLGIYDVKKLELIPYYKYARQLMGYLDNLTIEHIPRNFNQQADSLARLASMITQPSHRNQISICQSWVIPPMFDEEDDAVLPLECQISSLRIAIQEGFSEEDNVRLRLEELETLDEKRLEAQQRIECYQARLSKAFNKHVRPRSFQIGELVLAVRRPIILTHGGQKKFTPKWDGPYVVREVYTNGSYKLVAEDGLRVGPINGKYLKRYYA